MEENWLELIANQNSLARVLETNQYTDRFGLALTEEDAHLLMVERSNALKEQKRIEFGEGILPKLILAFCDSNYIDQNNYISTLIALQNIFYLFKNEMQDEITDDELINFMKEQFDTICFGDLDYLSSTCLANFAAAIRAGYRDYHTTDGVGKYEAFDEVPRWDYKLYMEALTELCWK